MMTKRIRLIAMIVMLAGAYFVTDANAAVAWYTAQVNMAGPNSGGGTYINLTDTAPSPAFAGRWFTAPASIDREMLATALTAIANGMKVFVATDVSLGGYPPIIAIYIIGD
jgi:hypothetical protein